MIVRGGYVRTVLSCDRIKQMNGVLLCGIGEGIGRCVVEETRDPVTWIPCAIFGCTCLDSECQVQKRRNRG